MDGDGPVLNWLMGFPLSHPMLTV